MYKIYRSEIIKYKIWPFGGETWEKEATGETQAQMGG
jgi:hypothetical protein